MSYAINLAGARLSAPSSNAYNFGTGNFTLQCWVKTTQSGTVIGRKSTAGGSGNGGFLFVIKSNGSIKLATDNGFGYFELNTNASSIRDGNWHQLTGVRNGSAITIYLDGNVVPGASGGNATPPLNVNNNIPLFIGAVAQSQEQFNQFTGQLDEIRIWNFALSEAQIKSQLSQPLTGTEAGLVGYYTFENQDGRDRSATANNASAVGAVTYTSPGALASAPSPSFIDNVKQAVGSYFNHLSQASYIRLLDTPHVWGMPFGKEIMPQALTRQAQFERALVEIIQKAKYRCDLSSLNSPDPDWVAAILGAIDTSLTKRMGRTQPTQFRFFFGQTPTVPVGEPANYTYFKDALIRLFRLRKQYWEVMPEIWMGRFYRLEDGILSAIQAQVFGNVLVDSEGTKMTWNHTKIISVDGVEALVGGHNLNMDLFRSYPPVHDVSAVVHGDAAYGPQLFLNQMWVCGTDLISKEALDTKTLTWSKQDGDRNKPNDPLNNPAVADYMKTKRDALVAMHESGRQTGTDVPYNNGEQPVPPGIRDQDLQTISDLALEVFQERITYNTYEGFAEYKKATRMLTLGKYWNGPKVDTDFQKASEIMKQYLIKNAKRTIKMSQMDLVSAWKKRWQDHSVCIWVLEALLANPNLQVQIVVSPLDAGAGANGDQYSFGSGASRTFDLMKYYMTHDVDTDALLPDPGGARASALSRLFVAPMYYTDKVPAGNTIEGDTYKWPNLSPEGYTATLKQKPLSEHPPSKGIIGSAAMSVINASGYIGSKVKSAPGNHAKIMIVDDAAYVIGSDNLYPGYLSEVDYLVEGADAVNELLTSYWNLLWQYSGPHAISGASATTASITVNYIQGGHTKSVSWTLGLGMSLLQLKQKMLSELPADGHADKASQLNVWGPNGMAMQPDTAILSGFSLKNGDCISVDFPGAGTAFG